MNPQCIRLGALGILLAVSIATLVVSSGCRPRQAIEVAIEDKLPVALRTDEAQFLSLSKKEGWTCTKERADRSLDHAKPEDEKYTCKVDVDLGLGVRFVEMELVVSQSSGGNKWVMPLVAYTAKAMPPQEKCAELSRRFPSSLRMNWDNVNRRREEGVIGAVATKETTDGAIEVLGLGCNTNKNTMILSWMYLEPAKPTTVSQKPSEKDFFKGIQIAMKVAPSKDMPSKDVPTENGNDTLSPDDIQRVMNQKFGLLTGCLREEAQRNPSTKKLEFEFLVKGNGSVSSVRVNGQTGTALASCLFSKMQAIQFPECKTCTQTWAAFSLAIK